MSVLRDSCRAGESIESLRNFTVVSDKRRWREVTARMYLRARIVRAELVSSAAQPATIDMTTDTDGAAGDMYPSRERGVERICSDRSAYSRYSSGSRSTPMSATSNGAMRLSALARSYQSR